MITDIINRKMKRQEVVRFRNHFFRAECGLGSMNRDAFLLALNVWIMQNKYMPEELLC
jgi:hypothetical protein